MPWEGSELWVAALDGAGLPRAPRRVAGGADESIFQPRWSPAGELHFVSDRSGWWNLYRERGGRIEPLHPMEAEFGEPQWVFGQSMYGFAADGSIVCLFDQRRPLAPGAASTPTATPSASSRRRSARSASLRVGAGFIACIAASETAVEAIVRLDLATGACARPAPRERDRARRRATSRSPRRSASRQRRRSRARLLLPAAQPRCSPASPARCRRCSSSSHGGPTGSTDAGAGAGASSSGPAAASPCVDVNYGGSTGYGRAYRERLDGHWGIVDVDDVVAAARFLVARGDVDRSGWRSAAAAPAATRRSRALTFRDVFHAGASHYGVSDLEALARDTHKFESRYLDSLIGP